LATEVLIATSAVRKHIRDGNPHLLHNEMQLGRKHKMQPMDGVLLDLYQRGEITYDTAISNARDANFIRQRSVGKVEEESA
jgi:twitching motility protein PilT